MADDDTKPDESNKDTKPNEDLQKQIDDAVALATAGLKSTNESLKTEKTKLREQFDGANSLLESLGGKEGAEQLAKLRERLEKDDLGKLLTEGKTDEWFDKRTTEMRKDHANQVEALKAETQKERDRGDKAFNTLQAKVLSVDIMTSCARLGVEPSAVKDVERAAKEVFSFDAERNAMVIRDADAGVVYGKDGSSPKTIDEWLDEQKPTAKHWWPPSKGGGAIGSRTGAGDSTDDLDNVNSMEEYVAIREKQGVKRY